MGLRMRNFNFIGAHWKIWFLRREFAKNQYVWGNCLKVGLGQFADLRRGGGGGAGKERGYFWGGLIPQCIVCPFKHFQYFVSLYVCLPHCFLVLYMLDVHSKVPMKYPLYVIPFVHLSCVFLQNSLQKLPDFLHEFMVSSNLKGDGA